MKPVTRLTALLLMLAFVTGGTTLTAETSDAVAVSPDTPAMTLTSPAGQSIALYQTEQGWQPVSQERLAELAQELDSAPAEVLAQLNQAASAYVAAEKGWGCEITKHAEGVWTWNCWRTS